RGLVVQRLGQQVDEENAADDEAHQRLFVLGVGPAGQPGAYGGEQARPGRGGGRRGGGGLRAGAGGGRRAVGRGVPGAHQASTLVSLACSVSRSSCWMRTTSEVMRRKASVSSGSRCEPRCSAM